MQSTISTESPGPGKAAAVWVAAGILLSKISGLVCSRLFGHYLGLSDAADAFRAAFRIPNFLQSLFGEGVLSASFIPVYARLRAQGNHEDASELAKAIFALLFACASALVLCGMLATPWLIDGIAPGFHGEKRELTIRLVRICFPGIGILVLSAWCLGILTSHYKFFLSYAAPVLWNASMIGALAWQGPLNRGGRLAVILAWATVLGSGMQFAVQLPSVLRILWPLRLRLSKQRQHIRAVLRSFGPVFVSRGVIQISGYIHSLLASLLPTGAVAALTNAQSLYMLPVSLFSASVAAAELPLMSSTMGGTKQVEDSLRERLSGGLEQIAFFVVPSAAAFLYLGKVVVSALFQTGAFGGRDVIYVWGVLAGAAVGLLAESFGRLYCSAFYALRDTRTPLKFASIRVSLTVVLGYGFAIPLPALLGVDRRWGVAGLTLSAGLTAWVEFALLRQALQKRIGHVPSFAKHILKLSAAATMAALASLIWNRWLSLELHPALAGIAVLIPYGLIYLAIARLMGAASPARMMRLLKR